MIALSLLLALASGPQVVGAPVPLFEGKDLAGKSVEARSLVGAPLLLNLWATWCVPCEDELPVLAGLHRTWAPRGVSVVGLAVEADPGPVAKMVARHALPYRILYDPDAAAQGAWAVKQVPLTLLYDASGRLLWSTTRVLRAEDPELKAALERALSKKTP